MYTKAISAGGHDMVPNPAGSSEPTEDDVVTAVKGVLGGSNPGRNDDVPSLFGIGVWTNTFTKRLIYPSTIAQGSNTIGTWVDDAESELVEVTPVGTENPSSEGWYEVDDTTHTYVATSDASVVANKKYWSSIIDESTWWYDEAFKDIVGGSDRNSFKLDVIFDPKLCGRLTWVGYILDDDTGRLCIKWAEKTKDNNAVIGVDLVINRTMG